MASRFLFLLALASHVYPAIAHAGPIGYDCKVISELHLKDDGSLGPYPNALGVGARFMVDRANGHIIESTTSWFSPDNATATRLAEGNSANSLVVTFVSPGAERGVHLTTLRVEEFADGLRKPFLLTAGGSVYSGLCQ